MAATARMRRQLRARAAAVYETGGLSFILLYRDLATREWFLRGDGFKELNAALENLIGAEPGTLDRVRRRIEEEEALIKYWLGPDYNRPQKFDA